MSKLPGNYQSYVEMLAAFSEGNPGAITALMEIHNKHDTIDPDAIFGPLTAALVFERLGFYGHKIWIFYKDVCHKQPLNCFIWFRLIDLTKNAEARLKDVVEKIDSGKKKPSDLVINYQELLAQVQEAVPNFNKGVRYDA